MQARMEKIGNVVLDYTYYEGQDFYTDGEIEDEMLDIAMNNPPERFPEIIEERKSWPVFYHFSPLRSNIIDWLPFKKTDKILEIGAGCGAVTGALARRAGSVTCVDLSRKRSLVNAYRNRDRDNITIMVGNFKDIEPHLDEDYDYVLLIGVGYDKNTSLHLADVRAEYPGRHTVTESSAIRVDGQRVWKSYETLAVDGEDFPAIGEAFEQTGKVRHVPLGNAMLSMMRQRELVDFAVKWIEENRK